MVEKLGTKSIASLSKYDLRKSLQNFASDCRPLCCGPSPLRGKRRRPGELKARVAVVAERVPLAPRPQVALQEALVGAVGGARRPEQGVVGAWG